MFNRWVQVTQGRTAVDFAEVLRRLVDEAYPAAEQIVLAGAHGAVTISTPIAPLYARAV